jgi:glycosyltransferase involved in cell wall biosynthesis
VISFIIPAHDEEQELAASLSALRIAAGPLERAYEIIVVDDASRDRTPDIAREHGAHVVAVDCRHIAATRNAGARHASGDVLVFVDADTHVHAPVLAAAMTALGRGAIGGGAAVRLRDTTALAPKAAARVFEWVFRVARIAPGCFIFCTRGAFAAAGGFDERYFAGEDVAFSRALARQGRFVILRAPVLTSARKLRTFSVREHAGLAVKFLRAGRGVLRSRQHLQLWYARRRVDAGHR